MKTQVIKKNGRLIKVEKAQRSNKSREEKVESNWYDVMPNRADYQSECTYLEDVAFHRMMQKETTYDEYIERLDWIRSMRRNKIYS